jgi:stringent starvation protein B
MSIAWPAAILPTAVPIEGFSHKRQSAGERTEMESGLARFRLTNRNPLRVVQIGWHMTQAQVEYFNAWMEYRARYGGAWFSIDLPLDGELRTVLARFSGDGLEQKPWRRTKWGIAAQLEVRDTNALTS